MTDLSQAIVNGFAIADTIKARREQQKQNGLNESYRRDTFAEIRRQFDLGYKANERQAGQVDRRLDQQDRGLKEGVRQFDLSLALDTTRQSDSNANDKRRLRLAESVRQDGLDEQQWTRREQTRTQMAAYVGGALVNGEGISAFNGALALGFKDKEFRENKGQEHAGNRNFYNQSSDSSRGLVPTITPEATVFVGRNAKGEAVPMTDDRSPGSTGTVARAPNELTLKNLAEEFADSPGAMAELRKVAAALRGMSDGDAAAMTDTDVLKTVAERAAENQKAADDRGLTPSESSELESAKQVNFSPGLNIGSSQDSTGLMGPILARKQALTAKQESATEPTDPAQETPAPAGLGQPPKPTNRQQAWRDAYNAGELGLNPSYGDVQAGVQYGVANANIVRDMLSDSATSSAAHTKAMQSAATNRMQLIKLTMPSGTGKNDPYGPQRTEQVNADSDMLAQIIGDEHFAYQTPLASASINSLVNMTRRAEVDDDYGNELKRSRELRVAAAVAAVNPTVRGSPEEIERATMRVAQLYNTTSMAPQDLSDEIEKAISMEREGQTPP